MTNKKITGAGGGKGGSAPTEVKDNQFSSVIARVLTAYSSGTTGGLVNGDKSIFLNETQLQANDNSYNFDGVTTVESDGTGLGGGAVKGPRRNFEQATSTVNVSTQVEFGTPIVRTVSDVEVDAVRIIITIPALQFIEEDGDIKGSEIQLKFEVRDPGSGIWEDRGTKTISGKSSGPFQRAYRVLDPDTKTGAWDWRVTRLTADSVSTRLSNDSTVQAAVEIFYGKEEYLGTACIGLEFATEDFGNSLPSVAFEVSGVQVQVPTNYTLTNGIPNYSGVWNGTFKFESTSNPVWHLYHLLIDDEIGLGMDESFVDRYNFYEAARYCDAVDETGTFVGVDDGAGGVRRRFTFNTQINGQQEGIEMLQQIASSMRGILYFGAGAVVLKQDAPRATSRIVTNENVKDGLFAYSSTAAKDRITVAKVGYNDPDDFFKLRYTLYPVEADWATDANIARFGRNELEVTKLGCASEAEAQAFAQWIVYTSCNEDRTVTFTGGPEFMLSRPGDVLEIADRRLAGAASFDQRYGGRIAPNSTVTRLRIDHPVTLAIGQNYTVTIVGPDGITLEKRPVSNIGVDLTYIDVTTTPFDNVPTTGYTWLIEGDDIAAQKFSVINVERKEGLEVEIFAVKYDENKFAAVESGISIIPKPYSKISVTDFLPATNMTFQQVPHNDPIKGIVNKLIVKWDPSPSPLVSRYKVRYRKDNDQYTDLPPTSINEVTLDNVIEGNYDFIVTAVNPLGYESTPLIGTYDVIYGSVFDWNGVPISILAPSISPKNFATKDFDFTWTRDPSNDMPGIVFKDYKVELRDGATLLRTEYVTEPKYTYYFDDMVTDQGASPTRTVTITVYERDAYDNISGPATTTGSNSVPVAPAVSLSASFDSITINASNTIDIDIAGYYMFMSSDPNFIAGPSNVVYKGASSSSSVTELQSNTSYYVQVAAYDRFSDTILGMGTLSPKTTIITPNPNFDVALSPINYNFQNISFTRSGVSNEFLNWTAGSVIEVFGTTTTTYNTTAGSVQYAGTTWYIFFDPSIGDVNAGTNLISIFSGGEGRQIIATFDGVTINDGTAEPIIDGQNIFANTVGATQVVTSGLITNSAQINDGLITTALIDDAAITTAKIDNAAITTAKIDNLAVDTAKITDLSVEYLKIGPNAVTDTGYTFFNPQAPVLAGGFKRCVFQDTITYFHPCVIVFTFDAYPGTATILGGDSCIVTVDYDGTTYKQQEFTGEPMTYATRGLQVAINGSADFGVAKLVTITMDFNVGMSITNAVAQFTYQAYYR